MTRIEFIAKSRNRILVVASVVALLLLPLVLRDTYSLYILSTVGIFVVLTQALNLAYGYTGMLPLCAGTFLGVGAYASALLSLNWHQSFWVGLFVGGVMAALLSIPIGYMTLKIRGPYFAITTLAFSMTTRLVLVNWRNVTGGPDGIAGIPPPSVTVPGIVNFVFSSRISYYYLVLCFVLIATFMLYRIINSPLGRIFTSVRDNEILAQSLGIDTLRYKTLSLSISAFFCGLAGSLLAHLLTHVSPELITFYYNLTPIVMTVVGGPGTFLGPIISSVIFVVIPELLRVAQAYREAAFGLCLIITILVREKIPRLGEAIKKVIKT